MKKSIRTGAITLLMATALAAQQGTDAKTPDANPGFGRQVPNDAVESGGQPHSNSTYQHTRIRPTRRIETEIRVSTWDASGYLG